MPEKYRIGKKIEVIVGRGRKNNVMIEGEDFEFDISLDSDGGRISQTFKELGALNSKEETFERMKELLIDISMNLLEFNDLVELSKQKTS